MPPIPEALSIDWLGPAPARSLASALVAQGVRVRRGRGGGDGDGRAADGGETGTGKEMLARLIHQWSPRRERAFVPINCAAIPNELMEAELFGYARGAFSGAVQAYEGQLAAAAGGTVF